MWTVRKTRASGKVRKARNMHYEVRHNPTEPCWTVIEVAGDQRKVIETHYGDHCDANERRHARERANCLANVLARKVGAKIVRVSEARTKL